MTQQTLPDTNNPIRWVDICSVMRLLGQMDDFSKGECLRVAKIVQAKVREGKVVRIRRGLYKRI